VVLSAITTVTIDVRAVNDRPAANPQTLSVLGGTARVITLTGSDGDLEVVQLLTFAIVTQPAHGTLSNFDAARGRVTYTSAAGGSAVRVAGGPAFLDAWIDFERAGTFDAGERVTPFAGLVVQAGTNSLAFAIPTSAVEGPTFLRLRLNSGSGGLGPTGFAADGE